MPAGLMAATGLHWRRNTNAFGPSATPIDADQLCHGVSGFAVDASLIAADANKQPSADGSDEVDWKTIARMDRSIREFSALWIRLGRGERNGTEIHLEVGSGRALDRRSQRTCLLCLCQQLPLDLKAAIMVDVEAMRAIRQAEVGAARTMVERTEERLELCPERLAVDSAYGAAEMLGWLGNERATEPHIPVFDKSGRPMGRSRGKTSPTINKTTFTSARLARR
ncbi:hypothetical protein HCN58_16285 [Bradyrhizobium sp. WSM 1791]|uniref:Transposase n=1 Tax=Bradyrhizobium australiense TaxID=2721161 RepID=A0A7Y4GSE8_9BRAD|nr:hypothetical protein [Bradyrhizobium australiense]